MTQTTVSWVKDPGLAHSATQPHLSMDSVALHIYHSLIWTSFQKVVFWFVVTQT